jgi:hypothetical protein
VVIHEGIVTKVSDLQQATHSWVKININALGLVNIHREPLG